MEENKNPFGEQAGIPPKQTTENVPEVITPPEENILPENEITETTNTAKENDMEVHHHTHTAHGKKNWKSYFWEFLMLFLAVFCGFLAEYQLEHKIERDRAKQYIALLYEDLKTDTTRINHLTEYNSDKIAGLTGMMGCYDTVSKNLKASYCMGELIKHSKSNKTFEINDRTLRQLANAGGFRLLNKADADSIMGYESSYKTYHNFESTLFQDAQDNVRNTLNMLVDFKANARLQNSSFIQELTSVFDTSSLILNGPLLFVEDRALLNKWFNELLLYLRATLGQRRLLIELKVKATGLLQYYNNKYKLD